jgi:translation initiation factor 2B subunit (eIF-2B alpha/beta/delta family)
MNIRVTNLKTAREAITHTAARDMAAVLLNSKPAAVSRKDAERLETAGVSFAYLCDHKGKVVTVPVN